MFKNKVAESGIVTLDLEDYYSKDAIVLFDMKDYLFLGLILKEKDFREALKKLDFNSYHEKLVAVTCTADAIIPVWAYMLITTYLQPLAKNIVLGDEQKLIETILLDNLNSIRIEEYIEKRAVIKGCGGVKIPDSAYLKITNILLPHVKSIMYGEPCSTVPVFKKR